MIHKNESLRILHKYLKKAQKRVDDIKTSILILEGNFPQETKEVEVPVKEAPALSADDPDFFKKANKILDSIEKIETSEESIKVTRKQEVIVDIGPEKEAFPLSMDSKQLMDTLKDLRFNAGLSPKILADTLEVTTGYYYLMEQGKYPKNHMGIAKKLAQFYNIQLTAMVIEEPVQRSPYRKKDKEPQSDPEEV